VAGVLDVVWSEDGLDFGADVVGEAAKVDFGHGLAAADAPGEGVVGNEANAQKGKMQKVEDRGSTPSIPRPDPLPGRGGAGAERGRKRIEQGIEDGFHAFTHQYGADSHNLSKKLKISEFALGSGKPGTGALWRWPIR